MYGHEGYFLIGTVGIEVGVGEILVLLFADVVKIYPTIAIAIPIDTIESAMLKLFKKE